MPSTPPRAVLFDFDGVLADTENVHVAAWERTFALMGLDVSPEVCARAAEEDDRLFFGGLLAERGVEDADVEGWVGRKQELTRMLLADAPRLYPGVAELVRRLAGTASLAVVTGTWRENAVAVLESAGLADAFAVIVGKEDVRRTKPDPEAYLLATRRLRVPPGESVALEDSPSGLASARGAGIRCLAVGHRRPPGAWAEGATYLPDLRDADSVLEALGI